MRISRKSLLSFLGLFVCGFLSAQPPDAPVNPMCQGMVNPTEATDAWPDFSWTFSDSATGDNQSAWRIIVSADLSQINLNAGDMWDSGKAASA